MNRLQALESAALLVMTARRQVAGINEGAFNFLWRVTRYLDSQSTLAFATEFTEAK